MRYLLLFLAAPGSFALIALAVRTAVRTDRAWREEEEDKARRLRLMNEYAVPDFAVEEVRVLPSAEVVAEPEPESAPEPPQDRPEIASRYTETVKS